MSQPRILVSGRVEVPRGVPWLWRVVEAELPDASGVLRPTRIVETTDEKDLDALGAQRWHKLTLKSALNDWVRIAEALLDELCKETTCPSS